jgi:hypothetical protein
MTFDFQKITGSEDSKQENFSSLCSRIVMRLLPEAKPVEGKGGDEGLDTFVGMINGICCAFQHKYFIERLGTVQRKQVEESLKQATSKHILTEWTLMIPINMTPTEIRWFDGLKKKYAPLQMDWWGKTKLQDLLGKYPDIANDFQPPPTFIVMMVNEKIERQRISADSVTKLINEAIGRSPNAPLPSDVVLSIAKDVRSQTVLKILIWGPGSSGGDIYVKRCEIRDHLISLGHTAHFSEDVWNPNLLVQIGLNLSVAEFFQAKAYDYIVCLMTSPGSIAEVHDFARYPTIAHKMLICVDIDQSAGYSALGVLRIFEGNHGKIDWFTQPTDLKDCHLATRIINQISKVAEAKQFELASGSS